MEIMRGTKEYGKSRKTLMSMRPFNSDDVPFLEQMLYEAIFVPDGESPLPFDIIHRPEISRYVDGFGQVDGDLCLIAEILGRPVGAVWCRLFKGYGYIDDETPELCLAVHPKWRGRGIGTSLTIALCDWISHAGFKQVSLSCDIRNPAMRLYDRLGFQSVVGLADEHSHTMVKRLV